MVIATVAGVVCLLLVAAAVVLFGRGDDDADEPPTTAPPTTQLLAFRPPPPNGVAVAQGDQPDQVVVTWHALGEAYEGVEYQVRPQTGDAQPQNTPETQATFTIAPGEQACYTVVAISADGRISDPSDLVCL